MSERDEYGRTSADGWLCPPGRVIPPIFYFPIKAKKTIETGNFMRYAIYSCDSATSCPLLRASGVTHVERRAVACLSTLHREIPPFSRKMPRRGVAGALQRGRSR